MTDTYVLVTASRKWNNEFLIYNTLTSFHWMLAGDNNITLVQGGAKGGDQMAAEHARTLGWNVTTFPASWDLYGKRAGVVRNQMMVDFVAAGNDQAVCLAFILDASKGATHCADAAEKAGIETLRFRRWYSLGVPIAESSKEGVAERSDPDILRAVENIERRTRVPEETGYLW